MACIDVHQLISADDIFPHENGQEFLSFGTGHHTLVQFNNQLAEWNFRCKEGPQICLKIRHQDGCGYTFAGNIGDTESDFILVQGYAIIVIPSDRKMRVIESVESYMHVLVKVRAAMLGVIFMRLVLENLRRMQLDHISD